MIEVHCFLSLLMRARLILHSWLIWSRAKRRWRHAAIIIALLLWEWYWRSARFGGSHMLQSAYNILIMPCLTFIWGKAFFSRLRQTLFVSGVLKFLLRLILIRALTLTVDFMRLHIRVCHGHFLILSSHDRVGCSSGHDIGLDLAPALYGAGLCLMATEVLSQDSLAAHETFYRSRVEIHEIATALGMWIGCVGLLVPIEVVRAHALVAYHACHLPVSAHVKVACTIY